MIEPLIGGALALGATGAAAYALLPAVLRRAGLHPPYRGPAQLMPGGARALIVTTSCRRLGEGGPPTGVFSSELTGPYYAFQDAGMKVEVASIAGGRVPIDPLSFRRGIAAASDRRALADGAFQAKIAASRPITHVPAQEYDVLFLAGGWGAAYDFAQSPALAEQVTRAWIAGRVVGGVCHGPLGLLGARDQAGAPLVRSRRLTAVTDRQIRQLGIAATPLHPERELRAAGAVFESRSAPLEIFADHAVADGRLITGQNQNAGERVAQLMMAAAGGAPLGG